MGVLLDQLVHNITPNTPWCEIEETLCEIGDLMDQYKQMYILVTLYEKIMSEAYLHHGNVTELVPLMIKMRNICRQIKEIDDHWD